MIFVTRPELVAQIRTSAQEAEGANYHDACYGLNELADAVEENTEPIQWFAYASWDGNVATFKVLR